ncbi:hypothetical protein Dimus_025144 [Dionaea muscipula]
MARRKEPKKALSQDSTKLSRRGTVMTCKNCKQQGHNRRSCKSPGPYSHIYDKARNSEGNTEDRGEDTLLGASVPKLALRRKRSEEPVIQSKFPEEPLSQLQTPPYLSMSPPSPIPMRKLYTVSQLKDYISSSNA